METTLILLAAGNSHRFGANKLLFQISGKPMYQHLADELEDLPESLFNQKVIVTQYPEIMKDMKRRGYLVVENNQSELGISHSIRLGIQASGLQADAFCFAVCDQPYLKGKTVETLVNSWKESGRGIGCLIFGENTGNPVIFHNKYREELLNLQGDTGGKRVLKRHPEDVYYYQVSHGDELEDVDENTK